MEASRLKPILRRLARTALPLAALSVGLGINPAQAQALNDALALAYQANPTLEAARAELRAADELVPQARSGYLPQVSAAGDIGRYKQETGGTNSDLLWNQKSVSAQIVQPIYRGGRTIASLNRAEALVQAQRASLVATEQSVLLSAASAYCDVVRDQAVLELNINNEQVLRRQLEASRDRFRVGEITRTDVSQSESRLALSTSNRIAAEGQLNASRAVFARLMGQSPEKLTQPAPTVELPKSLEATVAMAEQNNPAVLAAKFTERAADATVDATAGELLPSVSIVGSYSRTWDQPGTMGQLDNGSIVARVSVPIYTAGEPNARVRQAKQTAQQRRIEIDEAVRQARETGIRAWEALVTARASILSRKEQVRAANIALEGVRQEATVGSRTVLDTLDAEQEYLNAQVNLVQAERDEIVAIFQVLSATGQLTAGRLGLPVKTYDYEAHYNNTRDKLWSLSAD
ncbi:MULTISPECIES: TolC family outer membrane protein [unclassified Azospirillum]|uniref:TolC family outer membrane protein n=1 Tax=unclassified Azospirillum TaxID=2630922 RepID=UPI000B6411C9|nr:MULTISPECIES: TolC family outer membrane protein [unclassified Azospirillum]SNS35632.1 outer membrane protein/outer membrane protein, adhesin transport system [Azospirillum sp. RU38E]SNS53953.1 outer membrane protein/outer membrane protein, adhesin transport system [Azospirillum sp. RU37A]